MQTTISKPPFLPSAAAASAPAQVRTPSAAPAPADAQASPHPFAQMLKQNQASQPNAPAAKPAPSADDAGHRAEAGDADEVSAVDSEDAETTATHGRSADAPGRPRSARADERSTPRAARALTRESDKASPFGDAKATETDDPTSQSTPVDPALALWPTERPPMPDALPRDASVLSGAAALERRDLGTSDATPAGDTSSKIDSLSTSATPRSAPESVDGKRTEPDAKSESKGFADLVAQRLAIELPAAALVAERTSASQQPDAIASRLEGIAATPLFSAAAFTPAAAAAPIAAPVDVRLSTPVASPDFAQALGTQVSVLASNGVQRAELHLNPAEMGPVSVQIVIDGAQARVEFGADFAATRHAIENGLPELASALRDAGLTLTGGGVSQHARGRGEHGAESGSNPGRNARGGAEAEPVTAIRPRSVALGGVDLYA
ncbi:MAG: flagellar hook-length control protein FliK [Caldimonas sp.]